MKVFGSLMSIFLHAGHDQIVGIPIEPQDSGVQPNSNSNRYKNQLECNSLVCIIVFVSTTVSYSGLVER